MSEWDSLYQEFRQAVEQRKRNNFDVFMNKLNDDLTKDLDNVWLSGDSERYNRLLSNVKAQGIRVFRNDDGKHKLQFI